ncbi:hypothetical protein GOP47_0012673 [Adiantum capillus-veneris]|uniref:Uncharacterized protein n=1 Tax=Adiantum capillus-veneris TaxID=13818 RepID=A0A9D4US79_ADICA|nr:hypothetical protein GOP47_0012673 [Adiantum capillus-veneris]
MVGAKRSEDGKLATGFISRLAKELVNNSDSGFSVASNTHALKEALGKSVDSLPPGKLRATLQRILEQESQLEAFISALQIAIRALSVKLELHDDVLLTSTASEHLFETLLHCIDVKAAFSFTDASGNHVFSHDEIQLLLARDPAPHILWALAAVKFTYTDGGSCASASELLHCLKPWIIDRNASVAMVTMAPLIPLIFESLQQVSKDVSKLKTLRSVMKEVLSFTVAINYKEHFTKGFAKNHSKETLSFSALLDGCQAVFKAFQFQGTDTQTETHSIATKLSRMFPLASELAASALKPPEVRIALLADIVKSEFLLLYIVVEVLYCRQKLKGGDKMVNSDIGLLKEPVGRIAVNGLAAGQSDSILDILQSDMSILNSLLDDDEKSLVGVSVYKAILLYSHGFLENNVETLTGGKKGLEGFVKRIGVARKYASKQRTKYDIMKDVACYVAVPPKVVDYLQSCKLKRSLSQKEIRNNRALIDRACPDT